MKRLRKIVPYFMGFGLLFAFTNLSVFAEEPKDASIGKLVINAPLDEGKVILYEEASEDSNQLLSVDNGTEVNGLEEVDDFTLVELVSPDQGKTLEGYIKSDELVSPPQQTNEGTASPPSNDTESTDGNITTTKDTELEDSKSNNNNNQELYKASSVRAAVVKNDGATNIDSSVGTKSSPADSNGTELEGIVLPNQTNIYDTASNNSNVLQIVKGGALIKVTDYSQDWYSTSVVVDGNYQTGYIQKSEIDLITSTKVKFEGIAVKNPTNLYEEPTKDSDVLKTYTEGSLLKYYSYTSHWYITSVNVNGEYHTVYLNKDDVEQVTENPVKGEGISLKEPTNMYSSPSTNSKVLRTFTKGSYLLFYTYTDDWYRSAVNINGKNVTIYIKKADVELPTANPVKQKGLAINSTKIYLQPTKGSAVIKTYNPGSILLYYTYSSEWYKSNVTYQGAPHVVYINKNDVEQAYTTSVKSEGIALKNPTNMYASPTVGAQVLKTFKSGNILKYYTFSPHWNYSYVTVNGVTRTVYFQTSDIEQASPSTVAVQGIATKSPTRVYSLPTGYSINLKSYNKGFILKFYNYSKNWYKSYVTVGGKTTECYIKKADVSTIKNTTYNLSLEQAVSMQMKVSPLTDSPSSSQSSGSWYSASEEQLEYYLNPLNFMPTSSTYLQFLILSSTAGTNASELNNRILYGKGVLTGKGSSYIEAAKTYNINELYLISHSLLETGNGTSKLATGITVNGVKVYNVYGVGAYDSDPDYYGALFAYEHGWTSVEKAIIGGAQFVSENYIHAGQDTLYKMRWNPEYMDENGSASHQYASDIAWAVKQTQTIAQLLSSLTQFTLLYDLPKYKI